MNAIATRIRDMQKAAQAMPEDFPEWWYSTPPPPNFRKPERFDPKGVFSPQNIQPPRPRLPSQQLFGNALSKVGPKLQDLMKNPRLSPNEVKDVHNTLHDFKRYSNPKAYPGPWKRVPQVRPTPVPGAMQKASQDKSFYEGLKGRMFELLTNPKTKYIAGAGAGVLGYAGARALQGGLTDEEKRKQSSFSKIMRELVPVGAGLAAGYGGYRITDGESILKSLKAREAWQAEAAAAGYEGLNLRQWRAIQKTKEAWEAQKARGGFQVQ